MSKTQNITISNQSSKIFIYNATSEKSEDNSKKSTESNKTSIEIQFSTPDYHIRIENNSFKQDPLAGELMKKEKLECSKSVDADGDDGSSQFNVDEDVLMEGADGKFYLGTIINAKSEEYLVRFDDNTEKWSNYCKLKKLCASPTKNGVDLSLCVICKVSKEYDVVEICDKCSRGYHRQCIKEHNPSSRWNCSRCSFDVISISDSEEMESVSANEEFNHKPLKFPYDTNSLKWDAAHRTNKENVYCYCGLNGLWKEKMLQCCRCRQWFHDNCVKVWSGLLLHGDTFFIFCCSVCNEGNEFIRRLQIRLRDVIQLIFYHLTITRSQKYHSITKDVVPFILQNVDQLFLPPEVLKFLSKEVIEKKIQQIVRKFDIFKCVNANKKKATLYGLRKKIPPMHNYLQKVSIPKSAGPLTDDLMKKMKIKIVESIDIHNHNNSSKANYDETNRVALNENDKKPSTADLEVCDSSDETSSKSTLDLIIPPPDNFKGFNNPFHVNYKSDVKFKISEKLNGLMKRNGSAVASKFPEVRIVRTIKRRLSAKDLLLGPNQEVKRRKITKRRKSSDVEVISEIVQLGNSISFPLPALHSNFIRSTSSTSAASMIAPTKNDIPKKSIQSKSNYGSASKDEIKINLNDTVLNSPVKNNSINLYFGAMNRIENGEKFTILAKRVTFDRKEQYLLEWDGKDKLKDHDVF